MTDFSSVQWDENNSPEAQDQSESSDSKLPVSGNAQSEDIGEGSSAHKSAPLTVSKDDIYFHCTITDPQKEQEGSQNAYISYLLTTETNSPSFLKPVVHVRRRFSDFFYLYNALVNEFPASIVPPLPDKNRLDYLKGDLRFGPEFTLKRASSLTRFLTRIARHPGLKKSRVFYTFLESDDWNSFKMHRGAARLSTGGGQDSNSFLEGISDTLLNAFSKVNNPSKEMTEVKEKGDKLETNLSSVEKNFTRVVRRQGDLVGDLEEFSAQVIKLAEIQPNLSVEFGEFAQGIQEFSRGVYLLKEHIDGDYIVSLRDMENYIVSLKSLLKLREQKQLDYEALTNYLSRSNRERDNLVAGGGSSFLRNKVEDFRGVDHERSRKERLSKLETRIEDLTREVTSAKQTSEMFEEVSMNEVQIFENIKEMEMKVTLDHLCDYYISFYKEMIKGWENIATRLDGAQPMEAV
jgi:sorting nexin-4